MLHRFAPALWGVLKARDFLLSDRVISLAQTNRSVPTGQAPWKGQHGMGAREWAQGSQIKENDVNAVRQANRSVSTPFCLAVESGQAEATAPLCSCQCSSLVPVRLPTPFYSFPNPRRPFFSWSVVLIESHDFGCPSGVDSTIWFLTVDGATTPISSQERTLNSAQSQLVAHPHCAAALEHLSYGE
jgi:hypothetical protein